MSATLQQQVSVATRSQIEGQLAAWTALNNTLLEGVTRLTALNMQVLHDALDESAVLSREFIDAKNPQDFLAVAAEQVQPNIEQLASYGASYGRHVAEIANDVRQGMSKVMQEEIAGPNRQAATLMQDALRQVPNDAGPFGAWMKTALDAANAGYEHMVGTAAHMSRAFEENLAMTAATPAGAAAKPNSGAKRK